MRYRLSGFCLFVATALLVSGCGPSSNSGAKPIQVEGSTTMTNVAMKWADQYNKEHPNISVQVASNGSGAGIASLINGTCDLANASRKVEEKEIKAMQEARKVEPVEHIVGYDSIAIFVSKNNPIESISMDDLKEIYGKDGKITKWSDMGIKMPAGQDVIQVINRTTASGTYEFFREHVVGKTADGKERAFRSGATGVDGAKDVVSLVERTPSGIGYSGMAFNTPEVKMLKVSRHKGEAAVEATVENAKKGTYCITRPLQIYSAGEPTGVVKEYLDWIKGPEGQKIVIEEGCVPLN